MLQLQFLPLDPQRSLNIRAPLNSIDISKEDIDLFERQSLSLRNEEEGKETISEAEDAEHDECLVADVSDCSGGDFGDDEVEEPLCGS